MTCGPHPQLSDTRAWHIGGVEFHDALGRALGADVYEGGELIVVVRFRGRLFAGRNAC